MGPNLINQLPRSLTSLHLEYRDNPAPWFDFNTGEIVNSVEVEKLPEYSAHKDREVLKLDNQTFPPNITSLNLSQFSEIGNSFLNQDLKNLLHLDLSGATLVTDIAIPLLNRHLTFLNISESSEITGKSFPSLPRSLLHLDLSSSVLIYDPDVQHLPRSLKHVFLTSAQHLTDFCIENVHWQMLSFLNSILCQL